MKLWHDNIENKYYKIRQLLQNEAENSYYNKLLQSVTEVHHKVRQLSQSASSITKCDKIYPFTPAGHWYPISLNAYNP